MASPTLALATSMSVTCHLPGVMLPRHPGWTALGSRSSPRSNGVNPLNDAAEREAEGLQRQSADGNGDTPGAVQAS